MISNVLQRELWAERAFIHGYTLVPLLSCFPGATDRITVCGSFVWYEALLNPEDKVITTSRGWQLKSARFKPESSCKSPAVMVISHQNGLLRAVRSSSLIFFITHSQESKTGAFLKDTAKLGQQMLWKIKEGGGSFFYGVAIQNRSRPQWLFQCDAAVSLYAVLQCPDNKWRQNEVKFNRRARGIEFASTSRTEFLSNVCVLQRNSNSYHCSS